MKINYDQLSSTAERLHVRVLKFVTTLLTIHLWLLALSAIWFCARRGFVPGILLLENYVMMWALSFWMCVFSKRLRIVKRIIFWSLIWIPGLNLILAIHLRKLGRQEIDHTMHRIELEDIFEESKVCNTRYPILLVHGVGFRDLHYFNYWGRIPRELTKNGARVYYGHQEGWGTIEANAEVLKDKIFSIMKETGAEKVNIIAHSKGGLDSRYLISGLGMAEHVASLTTINTPHRGSKIVDFLKHLPDPVYRAICEQINRAFRRFGDLRPDAYVASYELTNEYSKTFNDKYPDQEGVYYQSYGSLMKNAFSSKLLFLPYLLLRMVDAPNDGLVTAESAQWTNFHDVIQNHYLRGISHADMIDLTREDYRGFDVLMFYMDMVQKLKELGY